MYSSSRLLTFRMRTYHTIHLMYVTVHMFLIGKIINSAIERVIASEINVLFTLYMYVCCVYLLCIYKYTHIQ